MSLYISSINSGSNGNCYYIGNNDDAVLIDVGISCREVEKRMIRNGLNLKKVRAVFISHEHSDHIKGVEVLSKKYDIPVYITPNTLRNSRLSLNAQNVFSFVGLNSIQIGELSIFPFSKYHDAADPYSFRIECGETTVGVFTDLGRVCDRLTENFKCCHAAFLEANYDDVMLENSAYPYFLKNRISGGHGHLSNAVALELFKAHRLPTMTHLFLCHLSENNNHPELVAKLFKEHANGVNIEVASRDSEGEVFFISAKGAFPRTTESQISLNFD